MSIRTYPAAVLRKKCEPLTAIDSFEKKLFSDMAAVMYEVAGIGLAAPQVGVTKRVIVLDCDSGILKMANPRLIRKRGDSSMEEGCLSVPKRYVTIRRADEIKVSYLDEKGRELTNFFSGLAARIIQHEIDHLNGKLIIDYLSWYKKIFQKRGE
ncbi:MAG: peptide deformylase [Candidatus Omnitrophica bacterium]|nr:peptide deformylase [Candidatus Omnitrophota bacterium]